LLDGSVVLDLGWHRFDGKTPSSSYATTVGSGLKTVLKSAWSETGLLLATCLKHGEAKVAG
jgi:hypothetical protein